MSIKVNGNELILNEDTLITSKTDIRGFITYANYDFIQFSGYEEEELIGKNHNIIRHALMPRIIFKILWDTIKNRKEINAFVINRNKQNFDYWVYANVTPSFNTKGEIIGYYSVRRKPNAYAIPIIKDLYMKLTNAEKEAKSQGKNDMEASYNILAQTLLDLNINHQPLFINLQKNGKI